MKQTPEMEKYEKEMKPGVISRDGFLGTDKRKLIDILLEDGETVKRLGLTHSFIADKMEEIRNIGKPGLGDLVKAGNLEISVETYRGKISSPFKDGVSRKIITVVKNINTDKSITYSDLNIDMINKHGFYEGRGAVFRIEPEEIVSVLEIEGSLLGRK